MVMCSKCGLSNPPGSKFCGKCGNSLQNSNSTKQQTNTQNINMNQNNQQKSGNQTKQICLGIIVIVVLLAIIGSFFGNSQPINLEEIKTPTGFFNGSHNKTVVNFVDNNADSITVLYNDKEEDVSKLPLSLEDRGSRIIKENKYETQNFEVNEVIYTNYDNYYSNLYFIKFDDKWYTVWYLTDHINYGVTNTDNPVNQVINSMINQYQS